MNMGLYFQKNITFLQQPKIFIFYSTHIDEQANRLNMHADKQHTENCQSISIYYSVVKLTQQCTSSQYQQLCPQLVFTIQIDIHKIVRIAFRLQCARSSFHRFVYGTCVVIMLALFGDSIIVSLYWPQPDLYVKRI